MLLPLRILKLAIGPLMQIAGFAGSIGDFLGHTTLLNHLSSPYVYVPLIVIGSISASYTLAVEIAETKIRKAGGLSKLEFEPRYTEWAKLSNYAVWHVAWLWNNWEPQASSDNGVRPGSPAYATYQVFKAALRDGRFEGAQQHSGSWLHTRLTKQQLIDFALEEGVTPKFLFQKVQTSIIARASLLESSTLIPFTEASSYGHTYSEWFSFLYNRYSDQEPKDEQWSIAQLTSGQPTRSERISERIRNEIFCCLVDGEIEAIGRRRVNDLEYGYEIIPTWKWEFMELNFGTARCGEEEYVKMRFRNTPKDKANPNEGAA
jgi:hypothetical protein